MVTRSQVPHADAGRIDNIRIVDGDSIEGIYRGTRERVRLYGIDAPEIDQAGGSDSAEYLSKLVQESEPLMMEVIDVDQYNRLVGILFANRSHRRNSLNVRMVRDGQAYAYTRFGGSELGVRVAERDAREGRRGIWQQDPEGGERPWDFRKYQRDRDWSGTRLKDVVAVVIVIIVVLLLLFVFGSGWISL